MHNRPIIAAAVALAAWLGAGLAAQRPVLTVGGTNPTHASLPWAVAAAAPGSVIIVRPGSHTGFSTSKPLRLVLDFTSQNGSIAAPAGANYAIEVAGLPLGGEFAIVGRGARVFAGSIGAMRVTNASGPIVIDGVTASVNGAKVALDVRNVASLIVQNSSFHGRHGLQVQDAVVAASDTSWSSPVGIGVVALRGTLEFAHGSFMGNGAPAIRVTDSVVRLAGDGSTPIRVTGAPPGPVSAFEAINSDVHWDSTTFSLQPKNGGLGFSHLGGTASAEDLPALLATGGPPGSVMSVTMSRNTPAPGLVLVGSLSRSHVAFGLAGIYLDELQPAHVLAVGSVGPAGLTRQASWPNAPWLLGEVFGCQGFVLPAQAALVRSGPAIWAAM